MLRSALATALATLIVAPLAAVAADTAPMPQTRGMQGMDPRQHEQAAPAPYQDCMHNADKAAQQAAHPMPETRGMQGMDPKAHEYDCDDAAPAPAADAPAHHEHRTGSN